MQAIKPIYHILFWIFIFFFNYEVLEYQYGLWPATIFSFVELMVYISVFYTNLYVLIPGLLESKSKQHYILGLGIELLLIVFATYIFNLGSYYEDSNLRIAIVFTLNFILYTMISFLYWYLILYQREKNNNLALKYEKLQAEMLLLKSQVSPHFLFNSLNNIYALSVVKHDHAPVMIEKLSDILRYIIYEGHKKEVHLEREIELINNYVDLQMLKKLKATENIKVHTKGVQSTHLIAPLILINIVENCFKHSDIAYDQNGFLHIELSVEDNTLSFLASNSFTPSPKKAGIGLQNIQQQLQHNYPEVHQLKIEKKDRIFKLELQVNLSR